MKVKIDNHIYDSDIINEWVECGIVFDVFYRTILTSQAGTPEEGLPSGMLLDLEGHDEYRLVGYLNQLNGCCDCCTAISNNPIIKRYIQLVIPQKATKIQEDNKEDKQP